VVRLDTSFPLSLTRYISYTSALASIFTVIPTSVGTIQQYVSGLSPFTHHWSVSCFLARCLASGDPQSFSSTYSPNGMCCCPTVHQPHNVHVEKLFPFLQYNPFPGISPKSNKVPSVFERSQARPGAMRPLLSDIASLQTYQPSRRYLQMAIHGCSCIPD